jgi:hypothetical protein
MKPLKTIRGLMLCIAIVGLFLGLPKYAASVLPTIVALLIVMISQIIIVAIFFRPRRTRATPPDSPDRVAPR